MTTAKCSILRNAGRALGAALIGPVLLAGCSTPTSSPPGKVARDPNLLVVYVACGLLSVVEDARLEFEARNKGKSVQIESDEPLMLVRRVQNGDVPDILVSPGQAEIGVLEREGFLDAGSRHVIGTLALALATPRGSSLRLSSYRDLAAPEIESIAMATPGPTSLGTTGKHTLERLGLWSQVQSKLILRQTPQEALEVLVRGETDAAILYQPCLRLRLEDDIDPDSVEVAVPADGGAERSTRVSVVVHKRSPNALLAERFIRILIKLGIGPAPEAQQPAGVPEAEGAAENGAAPAGP
jgi:molybdate transport system substrate-binding protein